MSYDLLIKNGSIVDGSGNAPFKGDVAVRDGKIAAIGDIADATATETIDGNRTARHAGLGSTFTLTLTAKQHGTNFLRLRAGMG